MPLEVLEDQRVARLDGVEIDLGARAFDVLAYLSAHSDRVVSKAELLQHVWSDLIVEEGNLSVQISGLRKALGKERIKTVPGVGYRLIQSETPAAAPPPEQQPALPSVPSMAVLPFANLTGSSDQDYLVDGIVTEVISALSRVSGIFVISSTSTFTYKGRSVDLAEVGQELGVRYVLEGSIQMAGNRIRIFTQLVEAESGHTIWQERFDGTNEDIFDLQDEVAESVVGALEPKLIWAEAARATAKPTESLSAYELCLRAAPLVTKLHSTDSLIEGLEFLRRALEIDPNYIHAKALFCYAHTAAFATRWWTLEQARAALPIARQVLESGTEDALALTYVGHYIAYVGRTYREGLETLKHAARLNPNSATNAMLLGWVHVYMDHNAEAIEELQRARRISPLHPHIAVINSGIGCALAHVGDYLTALSYFEEAHAAYPELSSNTMDLLGIYWALDRKGEARALVQGIRRKIPDLTLSGYREATPKLNPTLSEFTCAALLDGGVPER